MHLALVGNPNCGKTTLFNALTGLFQRVGNWTGVTVERTSGFFEVGTQRFEVIDLPGVYSLTEIDAPGPEDEGITSKFIKTTPDIVALNMVDASHLARNLYLSLQLLEQNKRVLVGLNRIDVAVRQGTKIDIQALSQRLGCPVVALNARQGQGIDQLKTLLTQPQGSARVPLIIPYPPIIETHLKMLAQVSQAPRDQVLRWLEGEAVACALPFAKQIESSQALITQETGTTADVLIATARYAWIERCLAHVSTTQPNVAKSNLSEKLDAVLCHRFAGLPLFFLAMYALFFFAIRIGGALQAPFESLATFLFIDKIQFLLSALEAPAWLMSLIISGFGNGLCTIISFVPVIGAMFFALAFLEDSGYMARAAFVMDRCMRALGLPGKSFVPMIVGFGCNVPAILGTRTLDNKRDRILAVMMSPFMSCGARLAIFTVFVAAFFPTGGQNIVFLLYLIGILMAVGTGLLLKKTLLKGEVMPLILEMPAYQWPHARSLCLHAWHRLRRFIVNAGKLILPVCVLVGVLNSISIQGKWLEEPDQTTLLAVMGQHIVPVFQPLGIEEENWPAAVGLLTGILAKEVVIGTLNSLYTSSTGTDPNPHNKTTYGEMVSRFQGQAGAFAYLLFVLLYFPCISATGAMLREVQKGWTLFSVIWTTGLAYLVAVLYFQCATFFEHPAYSLSWILACMTIGGLSVFGIKFYSQRYLPRLLPTRIVLT